MTEQNRFPGGRRFAFTVIDDTDVATVENVRPVYDLLADLGMRTTKTVWPFRTAGWSAFMSSQTLEDQEYLEFVRSLASRGFEIASHCASFESSERSRTLAALAVFRDTFGSAPRVFANHALNAENLYWGIERIDDRLVRAFCYLVLGHRPGSFRGECKGSPFYWADLAGAHHEYARNLTFNEVNLFRVNPTLPYQDPRRSAIPWWFSAADAEDCVAFVRLLSEDSLDQLEAEGGACIVATHFGKGFAPSGRLRPDAEATFRRVARRKGWFVPVGELLDYLRSVGQGGLLPEGEWRHMQRRWALDLIRRNLSRRAAALRIRFRGRG